MPPVLVIRATRTDFNGGTIVPVLNLMLTSRSGFSSCIELISIAVLRALKTCKYLVRLSLKLFKSSNFKCLSTTCTRSRVGLNLNGTNVSPISEEIFSATYPETMHISVGILARRAQSSLRIVALKRATAARSPGSNRSFANGTVFLL